MYERSEGNSGIEGISYQTLSRLSYWAGFVGIWTLIGATLGIIGSIAGMIANPFSIFGLISAIVALVMGLRLRRTKNELETFIHTKAPLNLEIGLDSMMKYFRIQGVLIILAIVFILITVIAVIVMGAAFNFNFDFYNT
ncbi:MAG TPA: DUF5362 family protein [Mesotoga infera]|jgi:amino acid transporter|uniref:DUF5362 domain-containing protein n=1 Tax=Mesotoga infera TaxID=1236046 RepID=A0A7Z7PMV9_9BACT|nr:DUF5362 family protein [Mesotoga infera]MBP8660767.1 hypothetical protein [Mesotoga sp.]MDY0111256.1 DUF5362 family protein [Candidatus Krumholzibacteria bacterium]NLI07750.1 DUF5362 domain-containing protein [Thermotogaceae bacterium]SSC12271.1 conserved membrane protein of unknown function [Mesotoga infera]HNR80530.1 DUF5362 family protein [Mesotoga infera]